MNSWASCSEVMVSYVGTKMPCFEAQSITTSMAVKPFQLGSCSMKSMDIESQGRPGIGRDFSKPYGRCLGDLF